MCVLGLPTPFGSLWLPFPPVRGNRPSPLRGEGILTPNPPAQNRRPVINVICNSTHVTIPDINITWESNPTHGPARCQYYVPICSGTGSVTPAFCAAKKSIFNFQPQSRAAPCISPAAPSEIKWTARPGGRALQRGSKASGAAGRAPALQKTIPQRAGGHMGPSLRASSASFCSAPSKGKACGRPKTAPTEKEKFSGAGG